MQTRHLSTTDRNATIALWDAAGLTRPWNDPSQDFDRAVTGPTSTVMGGFEEQRLVATAMAGHDGHRGWVYYLAVDPGRQGRGLGTQMMGEAEAWLRTHGVAKVNLMVRHSNAEALRFYEQLGYEDGAVTVLGRWLT